MFKRDIYVLAYERLKSNPGSMTPGTDEKTFDGFGEGTIKLLIDEMRAETYQCRPVKTVYIPKANGKLRKLGLPSARDKLVQEAVRIILESIYDSPEGPSSWTAVTGLDVHEVVTAHCGTFNKSGPA